MSFVASKTAVEDPCFVCFEHFTETQPAYVHAGLHPVHIHCILWWAQKTPDLPTCPICREAITHVNNRTIAEWRANWAREAERIELLKVTLYEAARNGRVDEVQNLLAQLGDKFTVENRSLAISFALKAKRQGVVELLIRSGDLSAASKRHLYFIAAENYPEFVVGLAQIMPISEDEKDKVLMRTITEKRTKGIPALLGLGPVNQATREMIIHAAFEKTLIKTAMEFIEQGPISEECRSEAIIWTLRGGQIQALNALLRKGPLPKETFKVAVQIAHMENKKNLINLLIPDLPQLAFYMKDKAHFAETYELISENPDAKRYVDIIQDLVQKKELKEIDFEFTFNQARILGHEGVIQKLHEYQGILKRKEDLRKIIREGAPLADIEQSIRNLGVYFREDDRIALLKTAAMHRREDVLRALLAGGPIAEPHRMSVYQSVTYCYPSFLKELYASSPLSSSNFERLLSQTIKANRVEAFSELLKLQRIPEGVIKESAKEAIRFKRKDYLKELLRQEPLSNDSIEDLVEFARNERNESAVKLLQRMDNTQNF